MASAAELVGRWGAVEVVRDGDRTIARVRLDGEPDGAYLYGASVLAYARAEDASPALLRGRAVEVEALEGDARTPLGRGSCQLSEIEQGGERWHSFQLMLGAVPPRETLAVLACHRRRRMRWLAATDAQAQVADAIDRFLDAGIDTARLRVRRRVEGLGTRILDVGAFRAYRPEAGHQVRFVLEAEHPDVATGRLAVAAEAILGAFPETLRETSQIAVVQAAVTGDRGLVRYLDRWGAGWRYPHGDTDGPRTAFLDTSLDPYGPRRRVAAQTCAGACVLDAGVARAAFDRFLETGDLGLPIANVATTADREVGLPLLARPVDPTRRRV